MVAVKMKVNRQVTGEHWKGMAKGVPDEYGNPFRIIRLRWNTNRMHKMTDYVKTRGFEDAILSADGKTGGIKIMYRKPGSIMWQRTMGIGPFLGELAYTPYNIHKLATHYGDKLWTILDADIDEEVKARYEKRRKSMGAALRERDDNRIKGMHSMSIDRDEKGKDPTPAVPLDVDVLSVEDKNRMAVIKEQELKNKEIALDVREKDLNKKSAALVTGGGSLVQYTPEYLNEQKIYKLRSLCRELKVKWDNTDKREDLVQKIIEQQSRAKQEAEKKAEGVIGQNLDS